MAIHKKSELKVKNKKGLVKITSTGCDNSEKTRTVTVFIWHFVIRLLQFLKKKFLNRRYGLSYKIATNSNSKDYRTLYVLSSVLSVFNV